MLEDSSGTTEQTRVGRAAGTVGFFTLLSRILGLIRDVVIANFFGAGMAADAFFVALRIPNLLRRLFAEGSLTISFIPVFTEYLHKKGKGEAFELARAVLTLLSLILVGVAVLGVLCSPWIVRIQAFGFGGSGIKYELTVLLTRITFPYIFFISLVAFFMGVLNSFRRFGPPAAAPIFLNTGIIGAAFFISPYLDEPVVGLAIGVLIGGFLQLALQVPWVLKEGLKLLPRWWPGHPAVKRIALLMVPAVFGSAVYQVNQFIITLLASFLQEGSVSWLYYADRLVQFPLGVFAIAISTAALPSLSTHAAQSDLERFKDTLSYALRLVFFISLPSMAGLIVLGVPIIRVLFERGAFGPSSTLMTYQALFFYTLGLFAYSGIRVMMAGFYALQDTKTPVKVASIALFVNLGLCLLLMGELKHGGLAFALSLASFLQFSLLLVLIRPRIGTGYYAPVFVSALKSGVAAALMGVGLYLVKTYWGLPGELGTGFWGVGIGLAILVLLGVLLYCSLAWIFGCHELRAVLSLFLRTSEGRK